MHNPQTGVGVGTKFSQTSTQSMAGPHGPQPAHVLSNLMVDDVLSATNK